MGAGSKSASFANSFAMLVFVALLVIVSPSSSVLSAANSSPTNVSGGHDSPWCDLTPTGPKRIAGTVKLWESPRQSRGGGHGT